MLGTVVPRGRRGPGLHLLGPLMDGQWSLSFSLGGKIPTVTPDSCRRRCAWLISNAPGSEDQWSLNQAFTVQMAEAEPLSHHGWGPGSMKAGGSPEVPGEAGARKDTL